MTFACKSEIISMTLPIGDPSSAEAVAAYATAKAHFIATGGRYGGQRKSECDLEP